MIEPELYVLHDWIKFEKLHYVFLSSNPNKNVIRLLEKNPEKIDWSELSRNPVYRSSSLDNFRKSHLQILWWCVDMMPPN